MKPDDEPVKPTEVIAPASKPVLAFMVETMKLDDPKQIRKRAELFKEAWPKTATAMIARAEMLEKAQPFLKSPFYRVSDYRWTRFIHSVTEQPKEGSGLLFLPSTSCRTWLSEESKEGRR